MNSNTSDQQDRIDELINQFERQLTDFIRSKDLEKKGLLLGELYCSNSEIKELLKEQTSIVSKRKIQARIGPLNEKFTRNQKEFLRHTELNHYEEKFKDIMNSSILPTKFLMSISCSSLSSNEELRVIDKSERISRLKEKLNQLKQNNGLLAQMIMNGYDEETMSRYRAISSKYRFAIQKLVILIEEESVQARLIESDMRNQAGSLEQNSQSFNYSNQSLIEEDQGHLQRSDQERQSLKFQSFNIDDEEVLKERHEEIINLAKEFQGVNQAVNQIQKILLEQGNTLETIEAYSEETLVQTQLAEGELDLANELHKKKTSKLMKLKGAILGAGVGFFAGGPIGSLVGGIAGVSLGTAISKIP